MTCAGAPQACRKGMIDILGTELRTNCGCEGTAADFRELYDCIGWHRILWVNPCVGEFNLDLFFIWLFCLSKDSLQLNKYETAPNFIQLTQNLTLDCLLI